MRVPAVRRSCENGDRVLEHTLHERAQFFLHPTHSLSILWYIEWNISNQDTNGAVESEVSSAMHNAHKSGS